MSCACGRNWSRMSLAPGTLLLCTESGTASCREFFGVFMSRTVLIVEDVESCSEVLEVALLAVPGIQIENAVTAEQALEYLDVRDISVMITDLNLPQMDGFELIRRVRSRPAHARMPILVISGDT